MKDGEYIVKNFKQIEQEYGKAFALQIEQEYGLWRGLDKSKNQTIFIDKKFKFIQSKNFKLILIGPALNWGEKCLVSNDGGWCEEIFISYIPGAEKSIATVTETRFNDCYNKKIKLYGIRYWQKVKRIEGNRKRMKIELKTELESSFKDKECKFNKKQITDFQNTLKFWRVAAREGIKKQEWQGYHKIENLNGECAFCEFHKENTYSCFLLKNKICHCSLFSYNIFDNWSISKTKEERKRYAKIILEWIEKFFIQENIPFPKRRKK